MSEESKAKVEAVKKAAKSGKAPADPKAISVDPATQQMIIKARADGVETIFDRAVSMKALKIKSLTPFH